MNTTTNIIYEQPLNEHIRICLRLEHLFKQLSYHIHKESEWDSHTALAIILDILNVIDRPDLKNKLGKALSQYMTNLLQLEQTPNIDTDKLHKTLNELDETIKQLHENQAKIAQELRENDFLIAIQQRITTPAGTCSFSLPAYHLWLKQPAAARIKNLIEWTKQFQQLQSVINLLLKLTRNSASLKTKIATEGFYQTNLETTVPYQLIRIHLPAIMQIYPEISVGKHRLAINFFELNSQNKSGQTKTDIQFGLACCKI